MMILIVLGVLILSIALLAFKHNASTRQDRFIVNLGFYALLLGAFIVLASELAGSNWHPALQVGAFSLIAIMLLARIVKSGFWGMVFFQAVLVLHCMFGVYLYCATQIPYGDKPFAQLSQNQPHELNPKEFPYRWITGLPLVERKTRPAEALNTDRDLPVAPSSRSASPKNPEQALGWEKLLRLMESDSQIRRVLQSLKESQERELSNMLAQLNYLSVTNTQMRRRALNTRSVENLLRERAISSARYHTIVETWDLLDSDELAFRKRQAEERFHALLELLEDDKVDESHKVDLIRYMVANFADDVRLLKPLIKLYEELDQSYPRQRRMNRAFLDLYIARCKALLEGFGRIGRPALQPLLDYRHRTISEMTYAKSRLDRFIDQRFGLRVENLYRVSEALSVPDFLNRLKYPELEKTAGASFAQDYIRRDLLQTIAKNSPPQVGEAVLSYPEHEFQKFAELFDRPGYDDRIDYWVIDGDPVVRANLAWYLADRKDPYLIPILFELMRDPNPEVRRLAAIAIGNFEVADTQGASDPKFIEIVKMLQNYRSNSDAFGRAWALLSLANSADQQKVLYVVDLILNDGAGYHSILGDAAPTWRSEAELHAIRSLAQTLKKTPEELLVKTYALDTLIALNSPESLGILLQYLHHIYKTHGLRPAIWRYILPHMTLPQEAENVEDVVVFLAAQKGFGHEYVLNRHLKALREHLRKAYEFNRSGEYFQLLRFLKIYDAHEYADYLQEFDEQIRIMRIYEYGRSSYLLWLWFWPISLGCLLLLNYAILPFFDIAAPSRGHCPNRLSNPAADSGQRIVTPAPTIVPIKLAN